MSITSSDSTPKPEKSHYRQYGITSLLPEKATAEDLLKLRREHWSIENKLHWVRDVIFDENASQARTGSIPHVMAALRNTAISVLRFTERTKISQTLREFAARPKLAVNLIHRQIQFSKYHILKTNARRGSANPTYCSETFNYFLLKIRF